MRARGEKNGKTALWTSWSSGSCVPNWSLSSSAASTVPAHVDTKLTAKVRGPFSSIRRTPIKRLPTLPGADPPKCIVERNTGFLCDAP